MAQISSFKYFLEKNAFGVCTFIAKKMGIKTERVRLYFLYITFGTLGSTIVLYLLFAFWINIKKYRNEGKRSVWDL
ncbi:MAG: PspC family transcriptional regulator [Bacteroidetes bacterium]|nr:PspC family transcriptional regulator [Bacteroidota bacterium]